jgi:hypothetical protein
MCVRLGPTDDDLEPLTARIRAIAMRLENLGKRTNPVDLLLLAASAASLAIGTFPTFLRLGRSSAIVE